MRLLTLLVIAAFIILERTDAFTANFRVFSTNSKLLSKETRMKALIECDAADTFKNEVLESPIPVIVDFYADWCGPCKIVAPIFKKLAEGEEYDGKVKFVKVNTDQYESSVDLYNIQGLPMFIIFQNGKVISSHSGALSTDPLKKFIASALSSSTGN
jgi:thioredoxin 1